MGLCDFMLYCYVFVALILGMGMFGIPVGWRRSLEVRF